MFSLSNEKTNKNSLDIHDYVVKNPSATFFMKMEDVGPLPPHQSSDGEASGGQSDDWCRGRGSDILPGDVLVVDRSIKPKRDDLALVVADGDLVVTIINDSTEEVWGKVIGLVRKL